MVDFEQIIKPRKYIKAVLLCSISASLIQVIMSEMLKMIKRQTSKKFINENKNLNELDRSIPTRS